MMSRLDGWAACAIALCAGAWLASQGAGAAEQPSVVPGGTRSGTQYGPAAQPPQVNPPASTSRKRKKLVNTFFLKLGLLNPVGNSKKALDDYYLIGTADLTLATGHADVRFQAKQGQQAVAEFLADYVLAAPPQTVRKWHVFSRLKDAPQAEQAVAQIRVQYDQALAYQEQIKQIYGAVTVRRC